MQWNIRGRWAVTVAVTVAVAVIMLMPVCVVVVVAMCLPLRVVYKGSYRNCLQMQSIHGPCSIGPRAGSSDAASPNGVGLKWLQNSWCIMVVVMAVVLAVAMAVAVAVPVPFVVAVAGVVVLAVVVPMPVRMTERLPSTLLLGKCAAVQSQSCPPREAPKAG